MSTKEIQNSGRAGEILSRILSDEGSLRKLSTSSGISSVTLRSITNSGYINSYVTAVALERATDGQIKADDLTSELTKGAELYRREPARSLLNKSFDEGISISRFLGRYELTPGDLWNFMNTPEGRYEGTKDKIRAVLAELGLNPIRDELIVK